MKSLPAPFCIVPMRKEPHAGIRKSPFVKSGLEDGHGKEIKPPYRPGEKCYIRETWDVFALPGEIPSIAYKSDSTAYPLIGNVQKAFEYQRADNSHKWRSPVTMPSWAARRFVIVKSCEPIRIEDVTEEDCIRTGYEREMVADGSDWGAYLMTAKNKFITEWHRKHPGKWGWRIISEEVTS